MDQLLIGNRALRLELQAGQADTEDRVRRLEALEEAKLTEENRVTRFELDTFEGKCSGTCEDAGEAGQRLGKNRHWVCECRPNFVARFSRMRRGE
jgi:hypothetical protein